MRILLTYLAGGRKEQSTVSAPTGSYFLGEDVRVAYAPHSPQVVGLLGDVGDPRGSAALLLLSSSVRLNFSETSSGDQ
jgi:hypothetical protein